MSLYTLPTPPASPRRGLSGELTLTGEREEGMEGTDKGADDIANRHSAKLRCPPSALSLLFSLLRKHEISFFERLPQHLVTYLESLSSYRAFQVTRRLQGFPETRAYYLHRYELLFTVAGLKPCLLLGFGDAGTREEALELDDLWIEAVWSKVARDLERVKLGTDEKAANARSLLDSLATLQLKAIEQPLRSQTGVFTNHYTAFFAENEELLEQTFHTITPDPDGWTRVDDEKVARVLDYPVAHPASRTPKVAGHEILDIEYRDNLDNGNDYAVAVTYFATQDDLEVVEWHFEKYRQVLPDDISLELWVSGSRRR